MDRIRFFSLTKLVVAIRFSLEFFCHKINKVDTLKTRWKWKIDFVSYNENPFRVDYNSLHEKIADNVIMLPKGTVIGSNNNMRTLRQNLKQLNRMNELLISEEIYEHVTTFDIWGRFSFTNIFWERYVRFNHGIAVWQLFCAQGLIFSNLHSFTHGLCHLMHSSHCELRH